MEETLIRAEYVTINFLLPIGHQYAKLHNGGGDDVPDSCIDICNRLSGKQ
jgi:hypothetical protein